MPGTEAFARALDQQGGRLLQINTDFVLWNRKALSTDAGPRTTGVYGSSKAAGEAAVKASSEPRDGTNPAHQLGDRPVGKNFALTMLRLHREQDQLGVVADQVGCPTSTLNLACLLANSADRWGQRVADGDALE